MSKKIEKISSNLVTIIGKIDKMIYDIGDKIF